jgi:hypothetical protein
MIDRQAMHSVIPATTQPGPSALEHDRAVRMLLRLAASAKADVTAVGVACDALGLSLKDALRRSEG